MKFGNQLLLGTYEPWRLQYIQYSKLKRIVCRLKFIADKNENDADSNIKRNNSSQQQPILGSNNTSNQTYNSFSDHIGLLQTLRISKNAIFYDQHDHSSEIKSSYDSDELNSECELFRAVLFEIEKINNFFILKLSTLRLALEDITFRRRKKYYSHTADNETANLAHLRDIYVELAALRSYCDLNQTGFYKIIKKYDKLLEQKTLEKWMKIIDSQPFATTQDPLKLTDMIINQVSREQLIEWERSATEEQIKPSDDIIPSVNLHGLMISLSIFIISLIIPLIKPLEVSASRCMSLLLLVISLWVSKAIPYYTTGLLIPPLVILMRVLKDNDSNVLNPFKSSQIVLDHTFNHTTMLLLGSYTISCAILKCDIEFRIISVVQNMLGKYPRFFILGIMLLSLLLSMWLSNYTAPRLISSMVLPIIRDLPTNSRFSKSLLLAISFSCNFGGMITPISSLQNALAVYYLEQAGIVISFGTWVAVALPFSVMCTVICWLLIVIIEKPDDVFSIPVIVYDYKNPIGKKDMTIIVLSFFTFFLFSISGYIIDVIGNIGIISSVYIGVMFGSGLLSELDFNSLSWHTLVLSGGGNVLGKAVELSGLLMYLSDGASELLPLKKPWIAFIYILFFFLIVSTFISHTIVSIMLMPLITRIGVSMQIPEVIVIGSTLAISGGMILSSSSFPNVYSLYLQDDFNTNYLKKNDYYRVGLPISVITIFLIATIGFVFINLVIQN